MYPANRCGGGLMNQWGKGDPVNLSDLLKITPVANEILHLSEELNMSTSNVLWIVAQILDNDDEFDRDEMILSDGDLPIDEWDDIELDMDSIEEEMEQAEYLINVRINGSGRFPEIGFKAGVNDKEDMNYFFDMVVEMLDKLE
ncbi:MAG TPA: hypothetical protein GX404_02560 [Syntrophomonadaceae bacterium]|nr:hypothetical protein [Syntrophomonadaceae bacterium]